MSFLEKAILLACQAHQGQRDKSGQPYIPHPLRMMMKVEGEVEKIAAVLHDVVEDTDRTLEDLKKEGFPPEVLDAVDCLSHREGESYEDFIHRVRKNPVAVKVKIADIEDNMDVRRLKGVEEKDWKRLIKYLKYWKELKEL